MDFIDYSLVRIRNAIRNGELSAVEVTKAMLDRIESRKRINAYITVCSEQAISSAVEVDKKINRGDSVGSLAGVPIAIKDNISLCDVKTTCASDFLKNYVSIYDATVVERLKKADAILIGKTNMDEFAMGSSNETSVFGDVLNPVDETKVPGGSSGGSAAAVADYECYGALGTDTGGSIRQPSAFCGVVGMKPSYSTVSRYGLIAFASSFDQIGSITRTVRDNAELLNVIAGKDGKDSTSINIENNFTDYYPSLKGLKFGIPTQYIEYDLITDAVKKNTEHAIRLIEKAGGTIVNVSLNTFSCAMSVYRAVAYAEAASNLSRFDGIKYGERVNGNGYIDTVYNSRTNGFGAEVKRRIMLGNYVLSRDYYSRYYMKASEVKNAIKKDFYDAFEVCDVILSPTSPSCAYGFKNDNRNEKLVMNSDVFTVMASISGNPAISVPSGKDSNGLPTGIQFIGPMFSDKKLYSVAEAFETENSR